MIGWILYSGQPTAELLKLADAAQHAGVTLRIVSPATAQVLITDERQMYVNGEWLALPDFVIAAFFGDTTYHNISLLNNLESKGVLCINKASTLLKTKDKLLTLQLLAAENIPVPKTLLLSFPCPIELIEKEFSYPLVLKVIGGSKGDGVILIDSKKQFTNTIQMLEAAEITQDVLVQEFIATSKGRDVRVLIADFEPMAAMVRSTVKTDEFKSNYSIGGQVEPFDLTPQVIEIARKVSKILDLNTGGIDLLFTEDGFKVCEANSMPGFIGMEKASGLDISSLLLKSVLNHVLQLKNQK